MMLYGLDIRLLGTATSVYLVIYASYRMFIRNLIVFLGELYISYFSAKFFAMMHVQE